MVNDKLVTEVRYEWLVHSLSGGVIVLDTKEFDEEEARMIANLEDSQLWRRALYVMEAEPVE